MPSGRGSRRQGDDQGPPVCALAPQAVVSGSLEPTQRNRDMSAGRTPLPRPPRGFRGLRLSPRLVVLADPSGGSDTLPMPDPRLRPYRPDHRRLIGWASCGHGLRLVAAAIVLTLAC